MKSLAFLALAFVVAVGGDYFYYSGGKRIAIDPAEATASVKSSGKMLAFKVRGSGEQVGVFNRILVGFDDGKAPSIYEKRYGLKLLKRFDIGRIYLYEVSSALDALRISAALYEEDGVRFAHPDMQKRWRKR